MSEEQIVTPTDVEGTKYFGSRKISQYAYTQDGGVVGILFEDESHANIPAWEFEKLVTDTPVDVATLTANRDIVVAAAVLEVLEKYDYPAVERAVQQLMQRVLDSVFSPVMNGLLPLAVDAAVSKTTGEVVPNAKSLRISHLLSLIGR